MAALDGTFPLPQSHRLPIGVADDLHFDVARFPDVFLQVQVAIAKGRLGLVARLGK